MRMLSEDGQMMRIMTLMAIFEFAMGRGDNDLDDDDGDNDDDLNGHP